MTKQDYINENAELRVEIERLKEEIRVAKSNALNIEMAQKKIDDYDKFVKENEDLKKSIESKAKLGVVQDKQLGTLLNGLNEMNKAVSKLFEHLDYMLGLAKENFNSTTNKLQNNLNKIMEESNGNSNYNEEV